MNKNVSQHEMLKELMKHPMWYKLKPNKNKCHEILSP